LKTLGYDVVTARNGLEASALLRKKALIFTLITDTHMPGMEGEELLRFFSGITASNSI
jgi:CheY-like chemotaxis protein